VITAVLSLDAPNPDSTELERQNRLDEALILESGGPGLWRVCDGRVPGGPSRLLALVEMKGDEFEVMQLANQFVWATFPTMHAALSHVVVSHPTVLAARPAGRLTWLQ
jgi:hypothetical protein